MKQTDARLVFAARTIRLFAYGLLTVTLFFYLSARGFDDGAVGLLLTLTLLGDAGISLALTTHADRFGRKRTLLLGAGLMILAGIVFAVSDNFYVLVIAGVIGVISPSGNEIGPFLSVEQASLSHILPDSQRTRIFAWYNLVGSFSTALGALFGGLLVQLALNLGWIPLDAYRAVIVVYALLGGVLVVVFSSLSPHIEIVVPTDAPERPRVLGLYKSQRIVLELSTLFALDAFAGGFIIQSIISYWFSLKFGLAAAQLGALLFAANILAGISALSAARLAKRFGLVNTMVFTHLPSNIMLMLIPLTTNVWIAATLLLVRFSISQMDVPTRQSYTMAVVAPDERSATSGITNIARSLGAAMGPVFSGRLLGVPALVSAPFFIAGGLKIVYDLLLFRQFRALKPPEEITPT